MKALFQQLCYALVPAVILASCQQTGNQSAMAITTDSLAPAIKDSMAITVSQAVFPKEVAILIPTQYRKESTGYPEGVQEKEWYEIYKDAKTGKWETGRAELSIRYGHDECAVEDVMIIQSKHEGALLFFSPFDGLSASPVTIVADKALFPEHLLKFDFNGKQYRLSPLGSCLDENGMIMTTSELKSKTDEELVDNTKISGYRLYFETEGVPALEIAVMESIEYATPKLLWAGDLNQDGLPDLILDLPDFYESRHVVFFLSDKSDPERPLKKVADLRVVNDC